MNYRRTITMLEAAKTAANPELQEEINDAIRCLRKNSDPDPKPTPDCDYNHDGHCWGQKCAPECTPGYGYCPLATK